MGEAEEREPEKPISFCLKCLFISLLCSLLIGWSIQLAV